jgi:hypothetical protein
VTIFIVIGIVLVIMLILTVYLVSILTPTDPGPKEVNSKTVKAYIEGCLSQIGANAVDEIGKKGGTFHPEKLSYWQVYAGTYPVLYLL